MYIATVHTWPFKKKYRCKGHKLFENGTMYLVLENEERIFFPPKYIIHFDDGLFKSQLNDVKRDSAGKAEVNHNLKGN